MPFGVLDSFKDVFQNSVMFLMGTAKYTPNLSVAGAMGW
jgi:hypothetical protein